MADVPVTEALRRFERAARAVQDGRLWRAREILEGRVGGPYDPELYLAYGQLLFHLGEGERAGKYLLLGGSEDPAHEEVMRLFLRRADGIPLLSFMMRLPSAARWRPTPEYRSRLAAELASRGYQGPEQRVEKRPKEETTLLGTLGCVIGLAFIGFVLFCAYRGLRQVAGF